MTEDNSTKILQKITNHPLNQYNIQILYVA